MSSTALPAPEALVYGDPHLHVNGDILALCYAADGTLWSVEEPGILRQWNTRSGAALLSHSLSDLETIWCFGPEACLVAAASDDLSIWEPETGNILTVLPQESWVTALAFHPRLPLLASGHDDCKIRIWDIKNGQLVQEWTGHTQPVSALAFDPDGDRLASAGEDKLIHLWDMATGKNIGTLEGHKDRIPQLVWHPRKDILVSAGWDTTARVWDVSTLEPLILLNSHATQVFAVAFSRDGEWLACSDSHRAIHIWRFADKKTVHVLRGSESPGRHLAFCPENHQLASGGAGLIHLWDAVRGQPLTHFAEAAPGAMAMCLSPDGQRLASNGSAGLQVWDTRTQKPLFRLAEPLLVSALAWSPDNRWIAGGTDAYVRLWDASSGQHHGLCEGPRQPITALAFTPDGKTLASASSAGLAVWLWNTDDGEPVLLIPDALDGCTVEGLAWHPGGRLLVVAGIDPRAAEGSTGAVSVWDIADRAEIATFPGGATCVTVDSQGQYVAAGGIDNTICLWSIGERTLLRELTGHEDTLRALVCSPDGRWLASAGDDRTLRLWNTQSWAAAAIHEMDSPIKNLAFSPDGQFLFTGNGNGICYRLTVQKLLPK